jgi:hypothetical protein
MPQITLIIIGPNPPRLSLLSQLPKPPFPQLESPSPATLPEASTWLPAVQALRSKSRPRTDGWNDWIFNSGDWDSQNKALNTLKHNQETFLIEWEHNLLATRQRMKGIGQAELDLRPSCLATKETMTHVFACKPQVKWQGMFIDSLRKALAKIHTQPNL